MKEEHDHKWEIIEERIRILTFGYIFVMQCEICGDIKTVKT